MKETRLEYLFPKNKNNRELEYLQNASVSLKRYGLIEETICPLTQKINFLNAYDIEAIANNLLKNKIEIPFFIQSNAIDIIGLYLGIERFEERNIEYGHAVCSSGYNSDFYKCCVYEAKYTLSMFLGVLNKLMDKGVNIEEYQFVKLGLSSQYKASQEDWNTDLLSKIKDNYVRADGRSFSADELKEYLSFSTVRTFLERIISLFKIESSYVYIENPCTIKPSALRNVDIVGYIREIDRIYKQEDQIFVSELCQTIMEKMQKKNREATILVDYHHFMEKNLENTSSYEDDFFEWLYTFVEPELQKELLDSLPNGDEILFHLGLMEKNKKDPKDFADERLDNLEKRVISLEKKVDNLKEKIAYYIENGGINPISSTHSLTREEVLKMIEQYQPKSKKGYLRKKILLASLKVSLFSLISTSLFTANPLHTKEEEKSNVIVEERVNLRNPLNKKFLVPIEKRNTEEEIILEIIAGEWGTGEERRKKLEDAGYDSLTIQDKINQIWDPSLQEGELKELLKK